MDYRRRTLRNTSRRRLTIVRVQHGTALWAATLEASSPTVRTNTACRHHLSTCAAVPDDRGSIRIKYVG